METSQVGPSHLVSIVCQHTESTKHVILNGGVAAQTYHKYQEYKLKIRVWWSSMAPSQSARAQGHDSQLKIDQI